MVAAVSVYFLTLSGDSFPALNDRDGFLRDSELVGTSMSFCFVEGSSA